MHDPPHFLDDLDRQQRLLPRVSRTFALTIPLLPQPLAERVANAYLLCRMADAIEDDPDMAPHLKQTLLDLLPQMITHPPAATSFAHTGGGALSDAAPAAERELVMNAPAVARITRTFPMSDRIAIHVCLGTLCEGMQRYLQPGRRGLRDQADLDRYCHYVAGVVGEMLTALFCNHRPELNARRTALLGLAGRFGRGLQLTNILKDVWDDLAQGRCWLPRAELTRAGYDLDRLAPDHDRPLFNAVLVPLISLAHRHLQSALRYTLLVPPSEQGIRQFCLWSIGLAMLTLQRIQQTPDFSSASAVKVPRSELVAVVSEAQAAGQDDGEVERLFDSWGRGLPLHAAVG